MSWQTSLFTEIYFHKETYDNKYQVEEELDEIEKLIECSKKTMAELAYMTEPKKFCGEDEDPAYYIQNKLDYLYEDLEGYYVKAYKLRLLLSNWDACHDENGRAIGLIDHYDEKKQESVCKTLSSEEVKKFWLGDRAYLMGDFIKSDTDPKDEEN